MKSRAKIVFTAGLIAATSLVCSYSVIAQEPDCKEVNRQAIAAMRSGDFAQAETLFKKALALSKTEDTGYEKTVKTNMAVLYKRMGNHVEAGKLEAEVGSTDIVSSSAASRDGMAHSAEAGEKLSEELAAPFIKFGQNQLEFILRPRLDSAVTPINIKTATAFKADDNRTMVHYAGSSGKQFFTADLFIEGKNAANMHVAKSKSEIHQTVMVPVKNNDDQDHDKDKDKDKDGDKNTPAWGSKSMFDTPLITTPTPPPPPQADAPSSPSPADAGSAPSGGSSSSSEPSSTPGTAPPGS